MLAFACFLGDLFFWHSPDAVVLPYRHRPSTLELPSTSSPGSCLPTRPSASFLHRPLRLTPSLDGSSYRNGSFSAKAAHSIRYGLILSCNGFLILLLFPSGNRSPATHSIPIENHNKGVDPKEMSGLLKRTCVVGGNAVSAFLSWRLQATNSCDVTLVWKSGFESVAQYGVSFKYVSTTMPLSSFGLSPVADTIVCRSKQFGNERFKPRHGMYCHRQFILSKPLPYDWVLTCMT